MRTAIATACAASLGVLGLFYWSTRGSAPVRAPAPDDPPAGDGAASEALAGRVARLEAEVARLAGELRQLREALAGAARQRLEPAAPPTEATLPADPLARAVEREVARFLAEERRRAMEDPLHEWLTELLAGEGYPLPLGDRELAGLLLNAFWTEIEWEGQRTEEALAGWNEARSAWQEHALRSYGAECLQEFETGWVSFRARLRLAAGGLWRPSAR